MAELAAQLRAVPALRADLELEAAGPEVVATRGLAAVAVDAEWQLRSAGAPAPLNAWWRNVRCPWPGRCASWAGGCGRIPG